MSNTPEKAKQEPVMSANSFTTAFTVDQTPEEVFAAINNVRGWWSGQFEGNSQELNGEFTYRYQDLHRSTQQITELVPGKRIAWLVKDAYLEFTDDKDEWNGTEIIFDISRTDNKTEIRFTHVGLSPESECFDTCSGAWGFYVNESLRSLIATGVGQSNQ
jgi:hypothetical protein